MTPRPFALALLFVAGCASHQATPNASATATPVGASVADAGVDTLAPIGRPAGDPTARATRPRRDFPAARFARLDTPVPAKTARWEWPDDDAFETTWRAPEDGRAFSWLVLEGAVLPEAPSAEPIPMSIAVSRASDGLVAWSGGSWTLQNHVNGAVPLGAWADASPGDVLRFDGEGIRRFRVDRVAQAAHPHGPAWDDWSYTTELLRSDAPIYDHAGHEGPVGSVPAHLRAAITARDDAEVVALSRALLRTGLSASDRLWGEAASYLASTDELDLAIDLRGRYWPMGQCSMDETPQIEGMKFADLCYEAGDRACYLQLQVRVMGDAVGSRMAWSSYGEASFSTHVGRIAEIGVDTERFLMGLVFRYDTDEARAVGLGGFRLARAMLETGDGDRYEQLLVAYAEDEALDEVNRHQAGTTLAWLRLRRHEESADAVAILEGMRDELDLPPMTLSWIARELAR